MKTKTVKQIKHLRTREETEPLNITRYFGACKTNGTASRDYPKELDAVTCPRCAAQVPKSRLHKQAVQG